MTNTEAKQQAIRKAYGEWYDGISDLIDDNGWVLTDNINLCEEAYDALEVELNKYRDRWRPLALKGIENNRGWVRIEGPEDLPKEKGKYMVLGRYGKKEEWYYTDCSSVNALWLECFTHWRPVEEVPEPVY